VGEDGTVRRVMISYAHESDEHVRLVGDLADFLRSRGIDAWLDQYATGERVDWVQWTLNQMRRAQHVIVVCSPAYRRRFEREGPPEDGRGVQLESRLIREEIMRDQAGSVRRFLPVLLGNGTIDDIPTLLQPYSGMHYPIERLNEDGCASLLRVLSGLPDREPGLLGHAPSGSFSWPRIVACLHMNGGTPLDRDKVARAFVAAAAADPAAATVEFGPDGSVSGALLSIRPDDSDDVVGRGVRGVHEQARQTERPVTARIGGHVAEGPGDDTVFRLVDSATARALHGAAGGQTVIAASSPLHELVLQGVVTFPRPNAYRSVGDDWFALAARSRCPEIPHLRPEASAPTSPQNPAQHVFVGQNNGIVQTVTGNSTLHLGDVINYSGPPR
jgi:hypothetical protein